MSEFDTLMVYYDDNFPSLHPYKLHCRDRSDMYALDNEFIIFDGNGKGFLTT